MHWIQHPTHPLPHNIAKAPNKKQENNEKTTKTDDRIHFIDLYQQVSSKTPFFQSSLIFKDDD
jgi:hypothetical protein